MHHRSDRDIAKFQSATRGCFRSLHLYCRLQRQDRHTVDLGYRKRMAIDDLVAALRSAT